MTEPTELAKLRAEALAYEQAFIDLRTAGIVQPQEKIAEAIMRLHKELDAARAEILKSDTLAWEALGKPEGTFETTTVERLAMAHGIAKGEVGRLQAELAAVKRQRDELVGNLRKVHEKIAIGISGFKSGACGLFLAVLEMHNLGPKALAAEQPKPEGGAS